GLTSNATGYEKAITGGSSTSPTTSTRTNSTTRLCGPNAFQSAAVLSRRFAKPSSSTAPTAAVSAGVDPASKLSWRSVVSTNQTDFHASGTASPVATLRRFAPSPDPSLVHTLDAKTLKQSRREGATDTPRDGRAWRQAR